MERLHGRYLNVPLDAVIHPVSDEVQKAVEEQQVAADQAISRGKEESARILDETQENNIFAEQVQDEIAIKPLLTLASQTSDSTESGINLPTRKPNWLPFGIGGIIIVILTCMIFGSTYIYHAS